MPIRPISELKSRFQNADKPDGSDFVDLIDTLLEIEDDSVTASKVQNGALPVSKITPGQAFQLIRTTSDGLSTEWFDSLSNQLPITQASHGFSVGEVLTVNGAGQFVRAKADALNTSQVVGIVKQVISVNQFIISTAGLVISLPFTVTPGSWHYLSESTAGVITTTPPSGSGQYVTPVLYGVSSNSGVLMIQKSVSVVTGTGTFDPVYLAIPVVLAVGDHGSFTTLNIDALVPAVAGTPFRFGIFQLDVRAIGNNGPRFFMRTNPSLPSHLCSYIQSDVGDSDTAPDTSGYSFFHPVDPGGPNKSVQIQNTSTYDVCSLSLIGYIP